MKRIDAAVPETVPISHIKPFRGVMEDIHYSALNSAHRKQPELTVLSTLIGMSSACDGRFSLHNGGRLNLYGIGIVESGMGKEFLRVVTEKIATEAGTKLQGRPASGPALEDLMEEDYQAIVITLDEMGYFMKTAVGKHADKNMIDLVANLLKLYSCSQSSFLIRSLSKNSSIPSNKLIKHPCLNLLGFSTIETLGKALSNSNIEDGLLGRMFFIHGDNDANHEDGGIFSLSDNAYKKCKLISETKSLLYGDKTLEISRAKSASEILTSLRREYDEDRKASTNQSQRTLLVRSFEKAYRIAGVLAVWDNPKQPEITKEHVIWAQGFVNESNKALLSFCEDNVHEGVIQAHASKIKQSFKKIMSGEIKPSQNSEFNAMKKQKVTRTFLLRATKLSNAEFESAIQHLSAMGEIIREWQAFEGSRKPVEVLHVC